MVLSSQTGRHAIRRHIGASRPNRSLGWLWMTVGVVLLVVVAGYLWHASGDGSEAPALQSTGEAADGEQTPALGGGAVQEDEQAPVLRFGMPSTAAASPPAIQQPTPAATPPATPAAPVVTPQSVVTAPPVVAAPAPPAPPAAPAATQPATAAQVTNSAIDPGMKMIAVGNLLEGRRLLSDQLTGNPSLSAADAQAIRDALTSANRKLVFSPEVIPGDTVSRYYTIESGDRMTRIANQNKITHQFIALINKIDPNRINAGQRIKVVGGPFHAVVDKSDFRMDIFVNDASGRKTYVRSFVVGLGEADSTPVGSWIIASGRKVQDPAWANPRTGEFFAANDPKNPIGEYWLALEGADEATKAFRGYGIHGTIDPASVGHQASMGCVRLLDADIELVYKMLVDGQSTVVIQP